MRYLQLAAYEHVKHSQLLKYANVQTLKCTPIKNRGAAIISASSFLRVGQLVVAATGDWYQHQLL